MICLRHAEKQQLFCVDDQQLVCMQCVAQDHQDHNFCFISKVASEHKTQLHQPLQQLQTDLKTLKSNQDKFDRTSTEQLQSQVQQTEKQIKQEFEKLHEFLREEEKTRIAALKEEEKKKMQIINEKVKEADDLCSGLSERIKEIEDDMKGDDSVFLHKFKDIQERANYAVPNLQLKVAHLIDVTKHLGNLKYKVWEKMKDICPYYPVILDPATKTLKLKLSEDLSSLTSERRLTPNSPEKNIKLVLGSEGFTSGTHTWEVEVGNNQWWAVGVIKESAIIRNFSNSSVLMYQFKGKCSWNPAAPKFMKVRVILDFEKGQVMFTDPDTNTTLQTQPYKFNEKMYPCFYTHSQVPLKILPAKVSVSM
ncbi:tripartite motif-containing protein 35-like [Pygocentrus nattereri]|uniref:tripartite motif-containing protein 35-like n=1 Tax=Pygocentrus nattereri TaxID=42514 RepID=UPI001890E601|nr:tripartite motif-containing protein 35-like [Pygocentrus nattereri]